MKRVAAILLLLIFGISSFTFKTHYCYYPDGHRFHGDCGEHITKSKSSKYSQTYFHEKKYVCHDIQLDKQFSQHDYSIKNFSDSYYIFPAVFEISVITTLSGNWALPIFSCRGGPPLFPNSLRAPPSC